MPHPFEAGSVRRALRFTSLVAAATAVLAPAASAAQTGVPAVQQLRQAALRADPPTTVPDCSAEPTSAQVANDDSWWVGECSDSTRIRITSRPQHGHLDTYVDDSAARYAPAAGYTGPDSVTYVASNAAGDAAPVTVSFDVVAGQPTSTEPSNCFSFTPSVSARATRTTTVKVFCQQATSITVAQQPANTDEGNTADPGSLEVVPAPAETLFDEPVFVYDVRYHAPNRSTGTVTGRLRVGQGDNAGEQEVSFDLEDVNANHPMSCDLPAAGDTTTAAAGFPQPIGLCSDQDADPISTAGLSTRGTIQAIAGFFVVYGAPRTGGPDHVTGSLAEVVPSGVEQPAPLPIDFTVDVAQPECTPGDLTTTKNVDAATQITCPGILFSSVSPYGTTDTRSAAQHGSVDITNPDANGTWTFTYRPDRDYVGTESLVVGGPTSTANKRRIDDSADSRFDVHVLEPPAPPATGGGSTPTTPTTPTTPVTPAGPTKAQIQGQIAGKTLPAFFKAFGKAFKSGGLAVKFPAQAFDTTTTATLTGSAPKGKASAAAKKKKRKTAKAIKYGSGKLSLKAGKTGTLKLKLTKAAKQVLKRKGKLKVTLKLKVTNPATGASVTKSKSLTLKAKKTKKKK